jgi:hypothetical protein
VIAVDESHEGSRPNANYHDRFGYRQERVSGPRHRREREDGGEEAIAAREVDGIFRGTVALPVDAWQNPFRGLAINA